MTLLQEVYLAELLFVVLKSALYTLEVIADYS